MGLARKIMRDEAVEQWIRTPNSDLGGRTPSDLIAEGQHQRVEGLLLALAEGVIS